MSWAALISWEPDKKGELTKVDLVAPTKWISSDKKVLSWPNTLNVLNKADSLPEESWTRFKIYKILLTGEKSVCETWLDNRQNTSASDIEKPRDTNVQLKTTPLPKEPSSNIFNLINKSTSSSSKSSLKRKHSSRFNLLGDSTSIKDKERARSRSRSPTIVSRSSATLRSRSPPRSRSSSPRSRSPSESPIRNSSGSRQSRQILESSPEIDNSSTPDFTRSSSRSKEKVLKSSFPMEEGRFQKEVIRLLLRISDSIKNNGHGDAPIEGEIFPFEPAETMEEFNDFETSLNDRETYKKLFSRLSKVGGKTLYNNVLDVMEKIFSNGVMAQFNMEGKERKNGKQKQGFEKKKAFNLVLESVRTTQPKVTDDDIKKKVSDVLKYAPDRPGGGGRGNAGTSD